MNVSPLPPTLPPPPLKRISLYKALFEQLRLIEIQIKLLFIQFGWVNSGFPNVMIALLFFFPSKISCAVLLSVPWIIQ